MFTIPAESWVSSAQGWRVFFAGNAYLPQHTPTALVDDRERELEVLRVSAHANCVCAHCV